MSQFEEIPSPGRGFQGSRALGGLAACKTLAITEILALPPARHSCTLPHSWALATSGELLLHHVAAGARTSKRRLGTQSSWERATEL